MALLTLLPTGILFVSALAVLFLHRVQSRILSAWLAAFLGSLAAWIALLVLFFTKPPVLGSSNWLPLLSSSEVIAFRLDSASFVYAFSMVGLMLAVILTAPVRLRLRSNPYTWMGGLILTALAVLSILSYSPLAFVLTWMLLDLLELAIMIVSSREQDVSQQAVLAFGIRVAGTLLLMDAMMLAYAGGKPLSFDSISPDVSLLLLAASGLRLGILPLHLPFAGDVPLRRGLGTLLRLSSPAISLALLARLPAGTAELLSTSWQTVLLGICAAGAVYGAGMWLAAKDEITGRPYWLMSMASFALGCVLRGHPESSVFWGAGLILLGSSLFLFSARANWILPILFVGLAAFSGLPFTPLSLGWEGLFVFPPDIWSVIFIAADALLICGFLVHAFRQDEPLQELERWAQALYPIGFVILTVSLWLVGGLLGLGAATIKAWTVGLLSTLLGLVGFYLVMRTRVRAAVERTAQGWLAFSLTRLGRVAAAIISFRWLYRLVVWLFRTLQRLVQGLTVMLEGAGGVLWAFVFLALLVTIVRSGGMR